MKTKTITLPLPAKELSPNSRCHWSKKYRKAKSARTAARLLSSSILGSSEQVAGYRLVFYWPDKRRRDRDNAIASCKSVIDGIADGVNQDDSTFDFDGIRFEIDRDNPRLEVVLSLEKKRVDQS